MSKTKVIILAGILIVILGFFYLNSLKNKPVDFLKDANIDHAYLEFRKGGHPSFTSKFENGHLVISNPHELDFLKKQITNLSLDLSAPHRPSDYSVYINFEQYREGKWTLKMARIDDGVVFFLGRGLYRNDSLAAFVNEKMEIKK